MNFKRKFFVTFLSLSFIWFQSSFCLAAEKKTANTDQCSDGFKFARANADKNKMDLQKLVDLASWVEKSPTPIFSILISQDGKVMYELYTPEIDPEAAHYLMSITKSVTSTLAGIAIDQHLITSSDESFSKLIPKSSFKDADQLSKFSNLSLKNILGMSALDIHLYPSSKTDDAKANSAKFYSSPNRLTFALDQKLVAHPGTDFFYNDVTPVLTTAAVQHATKQSMLDFAKRTLFSPMDFENVEWMHQDEAGFDNGAYGLRLRPIDMQKFPDPNVAS